MKTNFIPGKKLLLVLILACSGLQTVNAQVTLNLKLYIEGYYTGGAMRPVLKNSKPNYPNVYDCDYITVKMLDANTSEVVESVPGMLHVDGTCTVTLNIVTINTSYYINICHRNAVQVVSADPVPIVAPVTTYFFNTASTQAYEYPGNGFPPMKQVSPGVWALYSGDLNHDCIMDILDVPQMTFDIEDGKTGYVCTELNGDGIVTDQDRPILIANIETGVYCQYPVSIPDCDCGSSNAGVSGGAGILSGTVYTDQNENCSLDNGQDLPAYGRLVKVEDISGSLSYYKYTGNDGTYSFSLNPGLTYEVSLVNNSSTIESSACNGTKCNLTFVNGRKVYCVNAFPAPSRNFFIREVCEANIGIRGSAVPGNPVVCPPSRPSVTPCPGSKREYCVTFNTGPKDVQSGTVFELKIDNTMSFSGTAPGLCGIAGSYIDSRTIQWITPSCTDFPPGHSCTACVEVNVNSIPNGGVWFTTAKIQSGLNCCGGNENIPVSFTRAEGNQCSCDPNDKQVTPIGCGPQGIISPEKLTYTVHFQNVGAGPAHDVVVVDSLDGDLDVETFQMVGSSHTCTQIEILPDNLLVFTFTGIELPAEVNDAEGSNGYVMFSFLPKNNLPDGTIITNASAIYFDSNPPVITNSVINTITLPPINCGDSVTLNLKVFIEGYLLESGQMQPVLFIDELSSDSTACDSITVELHDATNPFSTVLTAKGLLHTDGRAEILLPYAINHFYYIVLRNRNALETWSKEPVLFNSKIMSFDFTSP